eukprot:scaffold19395_cov18-Prasinocladus_malaysianus.AAC.1
MLSDVFAQPEVTNINVCAVAADVVRLREGDSAGVVLKDGSGRREAETKVRKQLTKMERLANNLSESH